MKGIGDAGKLNCEPDPMGPLIFTLILQPNRGLHTQNRGAQWRQQSKLAVPSAY